MMQSGLTNWNLMLEIDQLHLWVEMTRNLESLGQGCLYICSSKMLVTSKCLSDKVHVCMIRIKGMLTSDKVYWGRTLEGGHACLKGGTHKNPRGHRRASGGIKRTPRCAWVGGKYAGGKCAHLRGGVQEPMGHKRTPWGHETSSRGHTGKKGYARLRGCEEEL